MSRLLSFASGFALLVGVLASPAAGAPDEVWTACKGDDPDTAIKACSRIIGGRGETADHRASVRAFRGDAYLRKGDYDRAIADFNVPLERFGNYSSALTGRGLAHLGKGDFDRALRDFEEAIRLDQKSVKAYAARGDLHRKKGDYDRAIADYDQAIQLDKEYKRGHNFVFRDRGFAFESKGDLDKALADFRTTVTVSQGSRPDNIFASSWEAARKDAEEGIQRIEQRLAAKLPPKPIAPQPEVKPAPPPEVPKVTAPAVTPAPQKKEVTAAPAPAPPPAPAPDEIAWNFLKATTDVAALRRFVTEFPNSARKREAETRIATLERELRPPVQQAKPAVDTGRRVALVIGNSAYKTVAALPNPRRDAEAMAAALRRAGFQNVTVATDLTREKLVSALIAFAREAEGADWGLIYYAGHGIELGGINYLIPVDARLASDRDVELEAVPFNQVLGAVERAGKLRLVLLDACRDNPFASQMRRTLATRSIGRGLASVEPEPGTLVVYAAKHGETALDGDGTNSPFVTAFVQRIAVPGLEVRRLFDHVRDDVLAITRKRQQPFSYGSLPASLDFYFVQK